MQTTGFPEGFLWGAASAAAQVEGGWDEGGRTPSIWDVASPRRIRNRENCKNACDHFHRYRDDVQLMKRMGLKAYRFSVSWSRVVPAVGRVNPEGLRFYSDLVDELIAAGIEPIVTLFHWDMPLWMHDKGGWMSGEIVERMREYVEIVVDALSDRVRWWITLNEPQCFIMNGYMVGLHAPFQRRVLALSRLTRNCMLAHGEAVRAIRSRAKLPPKVGIAMASGCCLPHADTEEAVRYAREKTFGGVQGRMTNLWWMDPILAGRPVRAFGIYASRQADMAKVAEKLDFVGLNIYRPFNILEKALPRTSMGWVIDERVMYWTVRFVYERYHLPVMITENGMADKDRVAEDGGVHDRRRVDFMERYLGSLKRAVEEGIPVLGYMHWSVMDNFEWAEGYDPRFGLIYVDYVTGERIVKDSAREYKRIIDTNGACLRTV